MTLNRVPIPSPNYSSRGGASCRLLVLHTTQGSSTIESLGSFFQGDVEASSHAGADMKTNTVGVFVERAHKSWTQCDFNPVCASLEMCAWAEWGPAEWEAHDPIVVNAGLWLGEEAAAFGIPLRLLTPGEAQGGAAGVCDHAALGSGGGGHWDVGASFPWPRALEIAGGAAPPLVPSGAPPYPGVLLVNFHAGDGTRQWQARMLERGYSLPSGADDLYGNESEGACRVLQTEHGLDVDGIVGPITWAATFGP